MTHLRPALVMLMLFTLLLGGAYPLAMTGLAQLLFPAQSGGSLLIDTGGRAVGSRLVGQPFRGPRYFWGRPSATGPVPNNALASSGSNLSVANPALLDAVRARIAALQAADPGHAAPVPVDLVTASGSGLDPHISPEAADYQLGRVARARGMSEEELRRLVQDHTEGRSAGLLGEPRVNVLALNLALDARSRQER